jgi:hypothetical protein
MDSADAKTCGGPLTIVVGVGYAVKCNGGITTVND